MDELVANRSPIDSQVWKWAWLGNIGCSAWFFRFRFRWQIKMAAKKAIDKMPMPVTKQIEEAHFEMNLNVWCLPRPMTMNSLTSLSVTQLSSSEVYIGPQLLIPLHRRLRGIQILDWVHLNSWQLVESLISVQMPLKPLAPTALSATKNLNLQIILNHSTKATKICSFLSKSLSIENF